MSLTPRGQNILPADHPGEGLGLAHWSKNPTLVPPSLMSTLRTDFEVGLIRDPTAFGVIEADAEDYVHGVRRGGVMVFASGSGDKAEAATEIMNRHGAGEVEKISASRPELPSENSGEALPVREQSVQIGRDRSSGSGARLFVWSLFQEDTAAGSRSGAM